MKKIPETTWMCAQWLGITLNVKALKTKIGSFETCIFEVLETSILSPKTLHTSPVTANGPEH